MTVNIEGFGKVTADKETLNNLAGLFLSVEDEQIQRGCENLVNMYSRFFNTVYEALDSVGFYDAVKAEIDAKY